MIFNFDHSLLKDVGRAFFPRVTRGVMIQLSYRLILHSFSVFLLLSFVYFQYCKSIVFFLALNTDEIEQLIIFL